MCSASKHVDEFAQLNPEMIRFGGEVLASLVERDGEKKKIGIKDALGKLTKIGAETSVIPLSVYLIRLITFIYGRKSSKLFIRCRMAMLYRYFRELGMEENEIKSFFGNAVHAIEETCEHLVDGNDKANSS